MNLKSILGFILRNWIIVAIIGAVLYFNFQPEKKKIIIVDNNSHNIVEVTIDDSRVKDIWDKGNTFIINNSYRNIILESVSYSTSSFPSSYTPVEYSIKSNAIFPTSNHVSYFFIDPPQSISVQSGGSTTRWFLRYSSSVNFY